MKINKITVRKEQMILKNRKKLNKITGIYNYLTIIMNI